MCYLRKIFLILLTSINCTAFCQDEVNSFYASIVVIEDSNLIKTIDSLIVDNNCINKRADLYLDYRKSNHLILGQGSIKQYIRLFKKKSVKVYFTFLNNNPFFIFSNEEENLPIRKTDFKIDLSEFLDVYDYSIRDLSSWYLMKSNENYKIVYENLFSCEESQKTDN